MESERELIRLRRLRMRVVRGLHLGHLHTGDRLPSIREIEREFGINGRREAADNEMISGLLHVSPHTLSATLGAFQARVSGL